MSSTILSTLVAYLLVEQGSAQVVMFRRTEQGQGFVREVHAGLDVTIPLPEIGVELPLAEVYDGVESTAAG